MIKDSKCRLLARSDSGNDIYQNISNKDAGWNLLNMEARVIKKGDSWSGFTGQNEYIFVLMGGNFKAQTSAGNWETLNGRKDVFSGLPHGLYLSTNTEYTITATSELLDISYSWCESNQSHPAQFVTPDDVQKMGIEHRGGDNASRQINRILPPGSNCHRLVCVEVYTPSGNWSSFPAHKHDTRKIDSETGKLLEAELEEIYLFKTDKPQGFALQKVYTDDRSLDEIAEAHNNDVVLVPEGYHPVIAGHGYNVYYLNFLAGSDQSLASSDDPDHKWIYGTWKSMDPRIPMVTLEMNKKIGKCENEAQRTFSLVTQSKIENRKFKSYD
ncbi:MAG: 5-deoxy-glucuronate isomerase [Bacteroidota bacterium]